MEEVYGDYPIGYDCAEYTTCMHTASASGYGQWSWFTTTSDPFKHMLVQHLGVRESLGYDQVILKWAGTLDILADGFTKTLPGRALAYLREHLQLERT